VEILKTVLLCILALSSVIMISLVLFHKGQGGGMSDVFGGGVSSSLNSSGVAERNLNRLTLIMAIIWAASIISLGVLERFAS
jgi:preprotein translocase subunit SecG